MAVRLSGLQREVIKLYRRCLREAARKPEVSLFATVYSHLAMQTTS